MFLHFYGPDFQYFCVDNETKNTLRGIICFLQRDKNLFAEFLLFLFFLNLFTSVNTICMYGSV